MRWFVEVSRVGDTSVDEKYCVEAKQWQAALQEARRLRGDSGPLSKFSIELLDDGYRAVDPKQKLRFVVAKAPPDAELTTEGAAPRNGQPLPSLVPSVAPPLVTPSVAPSASFVPVATPSVSAAPPAPVSPAAHAEPFAGVPSSQLSPHARTSAAPVGAPTSVTKTPSAFPPRPLTSPPRAASVQASGGPAAPADVIPPAPALPKNLGPAVSQSLTQPSAALDMPPPSSVLRKRQEEPTPESPLSYREVAYVVAAGVTRGSVEALLWAAFRDISRELAGRPEQKFVQLAVFDHRFDKRPERPPLGTLAWKDWRGNPVLTFPFFDGTQPARASVPAPSIKPSPVVSISSSAPPAPRPTAPPPPVSAAPAPAPVVPSAAVSQPPAAVSAAPPAAEPAVVSVPAAPSVAPPAPVVIAPAPPVAETSSVPAPIVVAPSAPASSVSAPPPEPASAPAPDPSAAIPLTREKLPSHPSGSRSSRPRMAAVRRRAGEDLIGELFETMHDLHFMQGVADGAEFMLAALDSVLPCDGVLIHVFDIDSRQFVVTRAKGPGATRVLLHRTPDNEPFVASVMRRPGSVVVADVSRDARILGPRWDALGVQPLRALCGPVRQGGRYLGMVEAVNPLGDAPFHQTEQNAVDYICEQFAQFLVNRPIVLDADVVLRR